MTETSIVLAAISTVCGAAGALLTVWFTGRVNQAKSVNDTDAGTTERALKMVDELRTDIDRLQARTVLLETQYRTLWDEHVNLQKQHARVSAELVTSQRAETDLRARVVELERAAAHAAANEANAVILRAATEAAAKLKLTAAAAAGAAAVGHMDVHAQEVTVTTDKAAEPPAASEGDA